MSRIDNISFLKGIRYDDDDEDEFEEEYRDRDRYRLKPIDVDDIYI